MSKQIPPQARKANELLSYLQELKSEDAKWEQYKTFGMVYLPDDEIRETVKAAYNLYFSENALNPTAFPSLRQLENEVVQMCSHLFHGTEETCGTMTSGGTESLLLAVKTAREWAKEHKPAMATYEVIIPVSAHPAFHKAFHYFGIKGVIAPVNQDGRVDVETLENLINEQTIMIVGSAPSFPHGVIDPIMKLSDLALKYNILLHVDSCIGGFILPFAKKLGYAIPAFDFALEGVSSLSADLHKYAYAAKGASIILYRNRALRKKQFFVSSVWNGGIYASTGIGGTRPGGAIAAAWTALNHIGESGYLRLTNQALQTTDIIKQKIMKTEELQLLGPPDATLLAFTSEELDIFQVADELQLKGWFIDRQYKPNSIHLTIGPMHINVTDKFVADLDEAVSSVKKMSLRKISTKVQINAVKGLKKILPENTFKKLQNMVPDLLNTKRPAALYGMMGDLRQSGELDDVVRDFLDDVYQ